MPEFQIDYIQPPEINRLPFGTDYFRQPPPDPITPTPQPHLVNVNALKDIPYGCFRLVDGSIDERFHAATQSGQTRIVAKGDDCPIRVDAYDDDACLLEPIDEA